VPGPGLEERVTAGSVRVLFDYSDRVLSVVLVDGRAGVSVQDVESVRGSVLVAAVLATGGERL